MMIMIIIMMIIMIITPEDPIAERAARKDGPRRHLTAEQDPLLSIVRDFLPHPILFLAFSYPFPVFFFLSFSCILLPILSYQSSVS